MRSPTDRAAAVFAVALLVASLIAAPGFAYGPGATVAEAVTGGVRTVLGQGGWVALIVTGFWIGSARGAGRPLAALVVGLVAGLGFGATIGAPARLDALIATAGLAAALALVARVGPAAGLVATAIIGALFGSGLGATLAIEAVPVGYVSAYFATFLGLCVALILGGALVARLVATRSDGRLLRIGAGWAAVISALLLALALLPKENALDPSAIDLRVDALDPDPARMRDLVRGLLQTVYLAYDEQDEEAIFDRLATVADGDTLVTLYLQKQQALAEEASGGAQSELLALDVDSVTELPDRGAGHRLQSSWTVRGAYGHWGHTHERLNRYSADLKIVAVDGNWKIAGFQLLDMARIDQPVAAPAQ